MVPTRIDEMLSRRLWEAITNPDDSSHYGPLVRSADGYWVIASPSGTKGSVVAYLYPHLNDDELEELKTTWCEKIWHNIQRSIVCQLRQREQKKFFHRPQDIVNVKKGTVFKTWHPYQAVLEMPDERAICDYLWSTQRYGFQLEAISFDNQHLELSIAAVAVEDIKIDISRP